MITIGSRKYYYAKLHRYWILIQLNSGSNILFLLFKNEKYYLRCAENLLNMKIVRIFIQTIIILIIAVGIFLTWISVSDYKPDKKTIVEQNTVSNLPTDTMSVLIWNIGYAGLGADMDFFYDGGKSMQTTKPFTQKNLSVIQDFLMSEKDNDFILLQEVDLKSKRSYEINEQEKIENSLTEFSWYFTYNYKVGFVPMPLGEPLGEVNSGLLCGTKHMPSNIIRYQFEGNYAWPKSLFMLDRCYTSMSFPLDNQDTLFIVNTHNTAYDEGNLRAKQMKQLQRWMLKKYKSGNYIIIGGDWNQIPPDMTLDYFGTKPPNNYYQPKFVPNNFLPKGWKLIYDHKEPTNRSLEKPLHKNSFKTIIDFFIISPNIEPTQIETINLNFTNSDHNPVELKFVFD